MVITCTSSKKSLQRGDERAYVLSFLSGMGGMSAVRSKLECMGKRKLVPGAIEAESQGLEFQKRHPEIRDALSCKASHSRTEVHRIIGMQ